MNVIHATFDHQAVRTFARFCSRRNERHRWLIHAESEAHATQLREHWDQYDGEILVNGKLPDGLIRAKWDFSICHNAKHPTIHWISQLEHPGKVVWVAWGGDYYQSFPSLQKTLYLPYTRLINVLIGKVFYAYERTALARFLSPALVSRLEERREFIATVKYCSTLLGKQIPCASFMRQDVQFLTSWYNTLPESLFSIKPPENRSGIVLGNSALNTNNHLDAMLATRRNNQEGEEVHAILSYGDLRYKALMLIIGKLLFRRKWVPLKKKLGLESYLEFLARHQVAIFFNTRSQGTGNLSNMLYLQYTIYLPPVNPLFNALKEMGFHLRSTDTLRSDGVQVLEDNQLKENAQLAEKIFSERTIHESMDALFHA